MVFQTHQRNARTGAFGFVGFLYIWIGIGSLRIKNTIMTTVAEREELKKVILKMVETEPNFVEDLIIDASEKLRLAKKAKLEQIVNEDFKEYDEVFKALA